MKFLRNETPVGFEQNLAFCKGDLKTDWLCTIILEKKTFKSTQVYTWSRDYKTFFHAQLKN